MPVAISARPSAPAAPITASSRSNPLGGAEIVAGGLGARSTLIAGPHPFAWLLVAALVLAVVAAVLAPDRAPAIALYWNPIYRAEIAIAVLAIAYLLGVAGWMAWNGQAFQRIELPGGAVLERAAEDLDSAARDFDEVQETAVRRIEALETSVEDLIDRLTRLEGGSTGPESRVP